MSSEADLWEFGSFVFDYKGKRIVCPRMSTGIRNPEAHFKWKGLWKSWKNYGRHLLRMERVLKEGDVVEAIVVFRKDDEHIGQRRPILDPLEPHDGTLVIGEEKKEILVHKQFLAAQSPYFDTLFNGDFKEKSMKEIAIGDVEYEEFSNIIKMVYGFDGASLTDENADAVLELAVRFQLKIVEDKVVNYLLSSASSLSIPKKLLFSDQYNLPFLKKKLLPKLYIDELQTLKESPEYTEMSPAMRDTILDLCREMGVIQ